jgi:hypothetical protein
VNAQLPCTPERVFGNGGRRDHINRREIADVSLNPSRTGAPMERNMSNPSRWVLINRFAEITGYSEDAVRHKVKNGTWSQGRIWRKAPDGRILVNLEEFERWVESGRQLAAH